MIRNGFRMALVGRFAGPKNKQFFTLILNCSACALLPFSLILQSQIQSKPVMKKLIIYFPCKDTQAKFQQQIRLNNSMSPGKNYLSGLFTHKQIQTAIERFGAYIIDQTIPATREHSIL